MPADALGALQVSITGRGSVDRDERYFENRKIVKRWEPSANHARYTYRTCHLETILRRLKSRQDLPED